LPVSLLCGFLGAGKTTLMKHILETKHAEEGFKCAVIVNDMAALNIDKSLIDQSALVQSDEVVAMQNGCFCCTLQSDLVDQIKELAAKKMFSYMLIEASGVSEPSQIAPLFDICDDEHDPEDEEEHDHSGPQLGEVARLDTCVTVVDSAEFYNNLASMKLYEQGESLGTIAELMMEQVEFSNVIVLNKQDLVSAEQLNDIKSKIQLMNPKAKIVNSVQSKIDVMEILDTNLYATTDKEEFWMTAGKAVAEETVKAEELEECCEKSLSAQGKKCCKSKAKDGQLVDSGLSQVQLGVVVDNSRQLTRHETRFGITSFIYRARRPFHPGRLNDLYVEPFFMLRFLDDQEKEEEDWPEEKKAAKLEKLQAEAAARQVSRVAAMGDLLRSKGFMWIATSHGVMGGLQQAGNIIRIESESPWMCEIRHFWEGSPSEEAILKVMNDENGSERLYGDRRQELVFIGHKLDHINIQSILDKCLLIDEEMELGPDKWEETWSDEDKIQLFLGEEEGNDNNGKDVETDCETEEIPSKKQKLE